MSKPPPKGTANVGSPAPTPPGSRVHGTRAHSVTVATGLSTVQQSPPSSLAPQPTAEEAHQGSPMRRIAEALSRVLSTEKLNVSAKRSIEAIYQLTLEAENAALVSQVNQEATEKVSEIKEAVKTDLVEMYKALRTHLSEIQTTANSILTDTGKVLKASEEVKSVSETLESKVNKVTDTTDKLASETKSYRDALRSGSTQNNKVGVDPKVLSGIDRRAKQILVDVYGEKGETLLKGSLTAIIDKANEALSTVEEPAKPADIKVLAALKTRGKAILLTLNSKEAVDWIREVENEMVFSEAFSRDSQIRQRAHNLVVPRVPTTLDPGNKDHLREIEETNGLSSNVISKARWIKPTERRRPGQTHAYAILTLSSADCANALIRDGLIICGAKVRPKKQKAEPFQCMKCRRWGHFATECKEEHDTCGRCGDKHRTHACTDKDKSYCNNCDSHTHTSWSRDCPEFIRKCLIIDERTPENAMPYFPAEQDWTLATRPPKIPLEVRFPAEFAVSNIQQKSHQQKDAAPHLSQKTQRRKPAQKGKDGNPNLIPLTRRREEGELPASDEPWRADSSHLPTSYFNGVDEPYPRFSGWD